MRSIISYFIKFPVAGNVLLIAILLFGAIGMLTLQTDAFPDSETRNIRVEVTYPGASPEEMEEGVILKIEDNLKGISGIERITSIAKENSGSVSVESIQDYDIDLLLTDVKNAVDRIPSFPVDLEPPVIFKQENVNFAISFALSGDVDLRTLKTFARQVETDLLAVEGISKVNLSGFPEEEIEISVREADLRAYQLTFTQVRDAVRNANLEITGGTIKTPKEELLIRARSKSYYAKELENIIVASSPDGRAVRLYEIADVRDRWTDSPNRTYLDGNPSVTVSVNNTVEEDVVFITDYVNEFVEGFNETHETIKATVVRDGSISLRQRRDLLIKNGAIGFVLVIVFLSLFLNVRLAFWVALAIPVCFMGMFMVGGPMGLTINVISLFGMIIVVGILVDDGIVISENIYQHYEAGKDRIHAAIDGTMEVFPAVLTAILTTMVAFSSFYFLEGRTGEIFSEMSFVVILTLLFSLVEGVFILPGHVAHSKAMHKGKARSGFERSMDNLLNWMKMKLYAPVLRGAIRFPLLSIAIPIALILIGVGAVRGGMVRTTFFPFIDGNDITVELKMPSGTREDFTDKWLRHIEAKAWEVNEELKANRKDSLNVIERISRQIGPGSANGTVNISLLDGEARQMPNIAISQMIRKKIGPIYEAEQLTIGGRTFFGKPISIAMTGNNLDELNTAVNELKVKLSELAEIKDITDSNQEGLRELNVELKEKARYLGLTLNDVVSQVRQGFFGAEVQRLQRGEDEVRVWVRFDEKDRSSIGKLEQMRIRLPDGREFPLEEVATLSEKRGVIQINRIDGKREIRVEADLAGVESSATDVIAEVQNNLLPPILSQHASVRASFEGQARTASQTQESGTQVMFIILFLMYLMSVLTFRSWGQALLVIPLLLPFGLIGVIFGHYVHGEAMSILTLLGVIALFGIMINDSLVLIAQFNNLMSQGKKFGEAVYEAGLSRFRAILLTSVTTIAGLYPLILETSFQARFLIPMAIAVAYGLMFATVVILVMVPAMLVLLNGYRVGLSWFWFGEKPAQEMVEPAVKGRKYVLLWDIPLFMIAGAFLAQVAGISPMYIIVPIVLFAGAMILFQALQSTFSSDDDHGPDSEGAPYETSQP